MTPGEDSLDPMDPTGPLTDPTDPTDPTDLAEDNHPGVDLVVAAQSLLEDGVAILVTLSEGSVDVAMIRRKCCSRCAGLQRHPSAPGCRAGTRRGAASPFSPGTCARIHSVLLAGDGEAHISTTLTAVSLTSEVTGSIAMTSPSIRGWTTLRMMRATGPDRSRLAAAAAVWHGGGHGGRACTTGMTMCLALLVHPADTGDRDVAALACFRDGQVSGTSMPSRLSLLTEKGRLQTSDALLQCERIRLVFLSTT